VRISLDDPIMRLAACLFLIGTVASCNSPSEPTGPAALNGPIVARDLGISIGGPPTIHVKESASAECGVVFLVRESTRIRRRAASGRVSNASLSELTVGRRVAVWANVILDSCPGQSSATVVELIEPTE
jgi:hypothetical protein